MKRHLALVPLSRDHHDGLVQAVRLHRAATDGDASARLAAAREFVEFFRNEERVHLRGRELAGTARAPPRALPPQTRVASITLNGECVGMTRSSRKPAAWKRRWYS